ncbi:hypothetical protein [Bacillus sp. X1(2014)]|nr:hypothetical protein [Bacillus sp. X1(2014)]
MKLRKLSEDGQCSDTIAFETSKAVSEWTRIEHSNKIYEKSHKKTT